jgi:hypothetical protein
MKTSVHRLPIQRRARFAPRRARWLAAAVGIVIANGAISAPQNKTIEECLETGTRAVNLPGSAGGTLSASTCTGCPTLRLSFDARTAYLIGKDRVSYTKFREAAAKGDLRLDVFYQPQTRVLTRLRLPPVRTDK